MLHLSKNREIIFKSRHNFATKRSAKKRKTEKKQEFSVSFHSNLRKTKIIAQKAQKNSRWNYAAKDKRQAQAYN